MGKVKTVIIGDIEAEEKARKAAEVKREQKKLRDSEAKSTSVKTDVERSQEILKMMEEEKKKKPEMIEVGSETKEKKQEPGEKKTKKPARIAPARSASHIEAGGTQTVAGGRGQKYLGAKALVDKTKLYALPDALGLVKKTSYSQFDGTIEAHFNVAAKGLRGIVQLPHGAGKKVTVAVADDNLINSINSGSSINFDILVAHPSMMPKLAKVAKILGPRGLMPNPKTGTIGEDTERLALSFAKGQTNWKTEPEFPIVHTVLGKVSFDNKKLEENYTVLAKSIGKDKIKSIFLKATMGPSVKVII